MNWFGGLLWFLYSFTNGSPGAVLVAWSVARIHATVDGALT